MINAVADEFTGFEGLDSHLGRIVPQSLVHFTELSVTYLTQQSK